MKHGSDRTWEERCARCAEVSKEVMAAARQANNLDQFYAQARARAAEVGAELKSLTGTDDVSKRSVLPFHMSID